MKTAKHCGQTGSRPSGKGMSMPTGNRLAWPTATLAVLAGSLVIDGSVGCGTVTNAGDGQAGSGSYRAGSGSVAAMGSGAASAGRSSTTATGAATSGSGAATGGSTSVPAACSSANPGTPSLPGTFTLLCSGCHSPFGAAANPAVPNLFTVAADPAVSAAAFLAQVRTPQGGTLMPPFPPAAISDADVQEVYDYFKAGTPASALTCPVSNGLVTAKMGSCSSQAAMFAPLFAGADSTLTPIAYTDPTTKHLVFRGAGRVRFRHEMEDTYEIYHDHYFEDRTFGYTLDDSTPAGGTTIGVTFEPDANQYYSKQMLASQQEGGADLNIRYWKIYGGVDGNVFAGNAGGASNNVLPTDCADPNAAACNTQQYTFTITRNDRENRPIQPGDQLQIEFGIFLAAYPSASAGGMPAAGDGPPADTTHVRNILNPDGSVPGGCTLNGPPFNNACYTQRNYYSDSFRYVVGAGTLTPANQDCTLSVPAAIQGTGADFPHPYDCTSTGPIAQAIAAGRAYSVPSSDLTSFQTMVKIVDRTGPSEFGWSGGIATIPYMRQRHDLYYSQMAPNILHENSANFTQGRRFFHTDFTTGAHQEVNNALSAVETALHANMAGPLYNQVSCEGCHAHNNRGVAPSQGIPFDSVVVKLSGAGVDAHGGPNPDPSYGKQLQNHALAGMTPEGSASFMYTTVTGSFADGTTYSLSRPTVSFSNMAAGAPVAYSVRLARPLIGLGLLEAIPEADILAHADPTDCNNDGIKGIPNIVYDPEDGTMKLGRFGWKASKASVTHQVAEALLLDIGVTTSVFPSPDCGPMQSACQAAAAGKKSLADSDLHQLVTYMREVAVPPRGAAENISLTDPQVIRGEGLFASIGCVNCHVPNQHTGTTAPFLEMQNQNIHPYTDLLLHDMGPDLADDGMGEYAAKPSMWRTAPLWGIGLCDEVASGFQDDPTLNPAPNQAPCHYLHDGRAASLLEAVLWHGGEAAGVKTRVLALPASDRAALVAFLQSL